MAATHSFTTKYQGRSSVLQNEVLISQAFDQRDNAEPPPLEKFISTWDTGATNTVISQKVIDQCGLKPTGIVKTHHVGGEETVETFLIHLVLPNKVRIKELTVSKGSLFGCDVLIGMDIIGIGDFAVTNKNGETAFSFRFPSVEFIDFVAQSNAHSPIRSIHKVGRNDPCPCGSGKKYKKCCGR
jgi:hypothetical protein